MKIGDYLKRKRLEKGYGERQLADIIGISVSTLYDLEEISEDELNGLSIPQMKRLCSALQIRPSEIYAAVMSDLHSPSLPEIVKLRRQEKQMSTEELSDAIGYYAVVIEAIEKNEDLERVCNVDAFKKLACELDLPFEVLLDKIMTP